MNTNVQRLRAGVTLLAVGGLLALTGCRPKPETIQLSYQAVEKVFFE